MSAFFLRKLTHITNKMLVNTMNIHDMITPATAIDFCCFWTRAIIPNTRAIIDTGIPNTIPITLRHNKAQMILKTKLLIDNQDFKFSVGMGK